MFCIGPTKNDRSLPRPHSLSFRWLVKPGVLNCLFPLSLVSPINAIDMCTWCIKWSSSEILLAIPSQFQGRSLWELLLLCPIRRRYVKHELHNLQEHRLVDFLEEFKEFICLISKLRFIACKHLYLDLGTFIIVGVIK